MMRLVAFLLLVSTAPWRTRAMIDSKLETLRQRTSAVFYHGYKNYMLHAFPEDELRPVSCTPLTRDRENPENFGLNDVLGNYSLTLIDSLSTLAILAGGSDGEKDFPRGHFLETFQHGIEQFVLYYGDGRTGPTGEGLRARGFDLDSKVQVFETVIRGVGGLLSAHLFAIGELPIRGYNAKSNGAAKDPNDHLELPPIRWPKGFQYDGQLLRLALDLAERLLPAFYTRTGIPYPRVNLRHGIPFYTNSPLHEKLGTYRKDGAANENGGKPASERTDTCSAGAGTLLLEFTVLSRLTGDSRFEQAAKRAFWAVYDRRSPIGLIGNGIDADTGTWNSVISGIGAGIDSFFEYALKTHILLSGHDFPNGTVPRPRKTGHYLDPNSLFDPLPAEKNTAEAFLDAWHKSHAAIKRHLYSDHHSPHYVNSHLGTGSQVTYWIDSLGAFYPGLLAMAGELEEAIETQLLYTALWTRYQALPERWSVRERTVEPGIGWWPGRPEFIESTYHIYRATMDPWYLYVGEMVLEDITRRCFTDCGWSGLEDVRTGVKSDRMESFFLGETAKYMYLLFDHDHPLNNLDAAYVFTTEGHPLIIPKSSSKPRKRLAEAKAVQLPHEGYYTYSCPAPQEPQPFTGSATAARRDIFHAASLTGLHLVPNFRGEVEAVPHLADDPNGQTKYRAKTNHSIFPWTLPPSMLPDDGICGKIATRETMQLQFPVRDHGKSSDPLNTILNKGNMRRLVGRPGFEIVDLAGMRMSLILEEDDPPFAGDVWRVSSLSGMPVGKDEFIHVNLNNIVDFTDPYFRLAKESSAINVILWDVAPFDELAEPSEEEGISYTGHERISEATGTSTPRSENPNLSPPSEGNHAELADDILDMFASTVKDIVGDMNSVFDSIDWISKIVQADDPDPGHESDNLLDQINTSATFLVAALPVGAGAALPYPNARHKVTNQGNMPEIDHAFYWTVHAADDGCSWTLPEHIPRENEVIVMRRGGCTFNQKLSNIPEIDIENSRLQLVVIVDEVGEEDAKEGLADASWRFAEKLNAPWFVQPRIDEQLTPYGRVRERPIPMVLLYGQPGTYEQVANMGMMQVMNGWFVQSKGIRIRNIVVV